MSSWSTRMDADQQPQIRHSVAILWRGDAAMRRQATPQNSRFVRVFEALAASGIEARPAVYDESFADAVRDQLLSVDGVLDRKSTRLNSSHLVISYAVFCLKKKKQYIKYHPAHPS